MSQYIERLSVSLSMFVLLIASATSLQAAEPLVSFDTDNQRVRYERMLEEYRCLKCQNQNLAGSNAALAGDLRREIREQILDGADDQSIDTYLVARYGEFVRYRPRFGLNTLVLWLAPAVLLLVGLVIGVRLARRGGPGTESAHAAFTEHSSESLAAARQLLDEKSSH
jgi:cytochrome c-type biogenesis protein CcmH